jgi:ankyrin repeat protein
MLVWLVEHGANVNTPDDKGVTVFLNAQSNAWNTKWSSPRDIFYMLDHGADVALRDKGGYGVLHYLTRALPASNQGGGWQPADLASFQASVLSIMNALLEKKADINVAGQDGYTPLMNLASRCNADVVRAFLAAGADPTMKNKVGKRAIDIAVDQAVSGNDKACNAVLEVLKAAGPGSR